MPVAPPSAPDSQGPLRRDVRLLGALLGHVIREQEGQALFDAEERVRQTSRAGDFEAVKAIVAALPVDEQGRLVRAFSLYFQLANLAEQHHRIRRRRQYAVERRVASESLDAAFRELEVAGVTDSQLRDAARRVSLELVLTAHPTEATRRTVLTAQLQISELLHRLDDPQLSEPGKRDIEDALAEQITTLWQTDETRTKRPRVVDEIRHGLWFFEQSLFDVAPALVGDYRRRIPGAPLPLRFGSWIGGDQDGNPNAGPATLRAAADRARELVLRRYADEVRELARTMGVSRALVDVNEALLTSIAADEQRLAGLGGAADINASADDEPYRRKLWLMYQRLIQTAEGEKGAYGHVHEFVADLEVIDASLRAHRGERIANGRLAALRRRVELFGFHVAKLDVRVHARDLTAQVDRVRETLNVVADLQRQHGPAACDTLILSGTTGPEPVITAVGRAPEAGLTMSGVPQIESIDDHQPPG